MTANNETPAVTLRVGADYIRDHFTRGTFVDDEGNVCAVGAMAGAWEGIDTFSIELNPLVVEAADVLAAHLVWMGEGNQEELDKWGAIVVIEAWNDRKVSDGSEAASIMRQAADEWEAGQAR